MGIKITDMTATGTADGTEIVPTSKSAAPRSVTVAKIKDYVVDSVEAIAAGTVVATGNGIFMLQSGVLKPVDIDVVLQRAIDTVWGKAAATPVGADSMAFKTSGGAEKTVTVTTLSEAVRGLIESTILDVSNLSDGSGALATTDYMLVTQGTTAKRITVQNLYDAIYTGLAAHVAAATNQASPTGTDLLYLVRGTTPYRVTLTNLATMIAATATLSGTGTAARIATWASTTALQAGPSIALAASGFGAGSDDEVPSSAAARKELGELISDTADVGAALTTADTILVYDDSGAVQRKAALSRVKTLLTDVYKTIWVPASAMVPSTTAGATSSDVEYGTQDMTHRVMVFAGITADKFAEFDLLMPEAWDLGTIKYKVYWTNGHADANVGEWVNFYLSAGARSNDDALDAVLGTAIDTLDQLILDDDMHVTAASAALTVGGTPVLGDMIHFKLGRDFDEANGGTAMDVDARVFGVLIQYRETVEPTAW